MTQVVSFTDYTPAARFDGTPWSSVEVYEAATSLGTWALIDTVALSPLDSDPTTPQTRSFSTSNASSTDGLWYRVRFKDAGGGVGRYSAAVQNTAPGAASFATPDELAARLGITLTASERARAEVLLGQASDLIRAATKQTLTRVDNDVLTIPGVWGDRILLPERPVISVASVVATFYNGDPVTIPSLAYYVQNDELVRYAFPVGLVRHFFTTGNGWLGPGYSLAITYSHGYDEPPGLAKTVALEATVRAWVNPSAASQTITGGVQEQYLGGTGMMLTDEEEADLADAFRRTAQSVGLR